MLTLNQGLLSFPCSARSRHTRGYEGTWPRQLTQTGQMDIPNTDCHAQDIKWGKLAQMASDAAKGGAGHSSAGGKQLYCASFFLGFLCILFYYHFTSITIVFQFISIIILVLPHPHGVLLFFLILLSIS